MELLCAIYFSFTIRCYHDKGDKKQSQIIILTKARKVT